MYGYVTPGGTVGQLFGDMPGAGVYHPDFIAAIVELPEGVDSGWSFIDGEWIPPDEPSESPPNGNQAYTAGER